MRRMRSRLRLTAQLVLFSLAFQLVASFEHVHGLSHLLHPSSQMTSLAPAAADALSGTADDQAPDDDDDYCTVCALIHLIGTVVAAVPPSPALPALLLATCINFVPVEFETVSAFHALFSARAPPAG